MIKNTSIFISYTRRDGSVTKELLQAVSSHFSDISTPYVHALDHNNGNFVQIRLLWKIVCSKIFILIISRDSYRSPWVLLEIAVARITLTPIIIIPVTELQHLLAVKKHQNRDFSNKIRSLTPL